MASFTLSQLLEPLAGINSAGDINLQDADALTWGTDLKLFRDGPWELALRDGTNDNFFYIYATFTDASNYERLALYAGGSQDFFIEGQTAGTGEDTINLSIMAKGALSFFPSNTAAPTTRLILNTTALTFQVDGALDIGNAGSGRPDLIHLATSLNIGITKTVPSDAIILEMANLIIDGFTDSQSILWTGKSRNSSINIDRDWQAFVDMTANAGTGSLWTLATRLDAASYVNTLLLSDVGLLTLPLAGSGISLGTNPALAGTIRLSNTNDITQRSVSAVDLNILSTPNSDEYDFLDATMPVVRIAAARIECNRIAIEQTASAGLSVAPLAGSPTFQVDTSTNVVRVGNATIPAPLSLNGGNGALAEIQSVQATISTPSGASATAASLIPAGTLVLAVTARVTTGITGPAGWDLGDGVIVDRWGNSNSASIGTSVDVTNYTSSALQLYPAANDVVITSDGVDFTGGAVRVIVHYIDFTAPTT